VPFTAVVTGSERTPTDSTTAAVTCAAHRRPRWRSCSGLLCKQGVVSSGHKTALRYPASGRGPWAPRTGNAERRRRSDGTALARRDGWATPDSNADSNADDRGWISMDAVGDWRVRHANALTAYGCPLPRSSLGCWPCPSSRDSPWVPAAGRVSGRLAATSPASPGWAARARAGSPGRRTPSPPGRPARPARPARRCDCGAPRRAAAPRPGPSQVG
jgi:hypothetical protein